MNGRRLVACLVTCSLVGLAATADAEERSFGLDSYFHIGQLFASGPDGRVDEVRMLSLGSLGASWLPTSNVLVRGAAGSVIGLLGPSFEVSLAGEYHPLGATRTGVFARLGVRGIVNVAIPCANAAPSCVDEERADDESRPADAIGPMLAGAVGEAGAGGQLAVGRRGAIFLFGSYLAGPLSATTTYTYPPVEGVYHGWLATLGIRYFF